MDRRTAHNPYCPATAATVHLVNPKRKTAEPFQRKNPLFFPYELVLKALSVLIPTLTFISAQSVLRDKAESKARLVELIAGCLPMNYRFLWEKESDADRAEVILRRISAAVGRPIYVSYSDFGSHIFHHPHGAKPSGIVSFFVEQEDEAVFLSMNERMMMTDGGIVAATSSWPVVGYRPIKIESRTSQRNDPLNRA